MKFKKFIAFAGVTLAFLLALSVDSNIFAQGRGNGGGNRGGGGGMGRPTTGSGVDRGVNTSSNRSNGRSDNGRSTASQRSNGRYDNGIERARENRTANLPSDNELNRYRGISRRLNITSEDLLARYEAALAANPNLKFGQFVAVQTIALNLLSKYPNITAAAILQGLENGDSIGETLQNLGLSREEGKQLVREFKRQLKESRNQE